MLTMPTVHFAFSPRTPSPFSQVSELPSFNLPSAKDRQGVRTAAQAGEDDAAADEAAAAAAAAAESGDGNDGEQGAAVAGSAEVDDSVAAADDDPPVEGADGVPKEAVVASEAGAKSGGRTPREAGEPVPPLEIARQAAQQALEAAGRAVAAYEARCVCVCCVLVCGGFGGMRSGMGRGAPHPSSIPHI